ncbi:uncharacterized protein LOC119708677 isoform X4 [Motacilla alba alba]|uniref:uncharacterized protein LOC119708677 isoform X4 n=1 Tax=Motacilla alba alba TaxID=1094192 RepID=UPI0018D5108B|nr:uncharacterized protein LOC119708677 isoform X4 [Motacilla alba alba]
MQAWVNPEVRVKHKVHAHAFNRLNLLMLLLTDVKNLSSMASMMELELTQKPEIEPMSTAPQKQEDFSESKHKDFCGPPKTVPHASIRLPQQHYVGQVLHFKCQTGYDKRPPTFGSRMCKEVNGRTFWTPLDMRCTNDSNQWPPQTIGPGKMVVITPQQCPDLLTGGSDPPAVVGRVGASKMFTEEALPLRCHPDFLRLC